MSLEGRTPIGRGRNAEVYEWGPGRVLRVEPAGASLEAVEAGRDALLAARSAGVPCPEVFDVVDVDGRVGLVMERLGSDMLQHLISHPWRVGASARSLARLHLDIVSASAPAGSRQLRAALDRRLDHDAIPDDLRDAARDVLAGLPDGDRLLHGDLHPGNVLFGTRGAVVIDWDNLCAGDPVADHAMTSILLRYGDPPGAPRAVQALIAAMRRRFATAYERAFRRAMPVPEDLVDRWRCVLATARLTEEIGSERPHLLRLLRDRRPL